MSIDFDSSLKAVLAELDKLPVKIEANLVRGALRAAAKPMYDAAMDRVPVSTGALKYTIRISSGIKAKTGEITAKVVAGSRQKGGDGAFYAHMVEWGTAKHIIKGPVSIGGKTYTNVQHPGAKARPFMRPAFDTADQLVVDAYAAYMIKNIDKALSKHGIS